MILNWCKREMALHLIGSSTNYPTYFMLGSGSGTVINSQTTLIHPWDRQLQTSAIGSTTYKVKWTGDWNSVEVSGLTLTEYGLCVSGTGLTGSIWSRNCFAGIGFNGINELRIEETWQVY